MTTPRFRRAACLGAVMLLALTGAAPAAPLVTDVPQAAGNAQGPAPFRFYGTTGSRVQQVYESALFAAFGDAPRSITAMAFRAFPGATPNAFFGNTLNIADVQIRLSTTDRGDETGITLSPNVAANPGADATLVYGGGLTLTTLAPGSFDYLVTFQTPFRYDPRAGNLLLDVTIPPGASVGGSGLFGFLTFDTVNTLNDGIYSVVNINNGAAATGTLSTAGAITRFFSNDAAPIPEPAGLAVLAAGLAGLGAIRRLRLA